MSSFHLFFTRLLILSLLPVLASYAQYLTEEHLKVQQYLDRHEYVHNNSRYDDLRSLRNFRSDWYELEEEYLDNWGD